MKKLTCTHTHSVRITLPSADAKFMFVNTGSLCHAITVAHVVRMNYT